MTDKGDAVKISCCAFYDKIFVTKYQLQAGDEY